MSSVAQPLPLPPDKDIIVIDITTNYVYQTAILCIKDAEPLDKEEGVHYKEEEKEAVVTGVLETWKLHDEQLKVRMCGKGDELMLTQVTSMAYVWEIDVIIQEVLKKYTLCHHYGSKADLPVEVSLDKCGYPPSERESIIGVTRPRGGTGTSYMKHLKIVYRSATDPGACRAPLPAHLHHAAAHGRHRLHRARPGKPVAQLSIYPLKSCKGVRVSEAECTPLGLRSSHLLHRFWLMIKEDGHMVTAQQEPRLVLVSIAAEGDRLVLSAPGMDPLVLPSKLPSSNSIQNCRILGLDIQGRDCSGEVAQWFTSYPKTEAFRLVQFEKNMKGRKGREILPDIKEKYQVAYPDCSPVMVLSDASLADLNSRLEKKATMDNFWHNIVVMGCGAFEEDTWEGLVIGSVEMRKVLSCPRCIMTTMDPDTGVIDRKEPLETLKS
ncbi:mitochondrial amidoxime reducing component 2-like [Sorex fumeus]|uniref:mitochondrial amidoxime reducing component 2-like n=1 Tax=Sorex fumeus TaxID=62283 RepID=UPI0024AE6DEE|nr:mitochondrial amidoxime reducing component 2-like [Sorex fumeus]